MRTRKLDPNNLGLNEDWHGNNVALTCPVCSKVYIVSTFPKKEERPCPNCNKSRAIVTGSKDGGTASITWDNASPFVIGQTYTRRQIRAELGGSEINYLPTEDGEVVCGCFNRECNPQAPDIIIPGTGPEIERSAEIFCAQDFAIPVFVKRCPNEWEYVGNYKAERFSTDPAEIAAHHNGSITPPEAVTRVIFLKRENA